MVVIPSQNRGQDDTEWIRMPFEMQPWHNVMPIRLVSTY